MAEPETQAPAPIREALIVAPEQPSGDLWQRIRAGYAMKDLNSPLIKRHEKWYASHPDYVLRMSERARVTCSTSWKKWNAAICLRKSPCCR